MIAYVENSARPVTWARDTGTEHYRTDLNFFGGYHIAVGGVASLCAVGRDFGVFSPCSILVSDIQSIFRVHRGDTRRL